MSKKNDRSKQAGSVDTTGLAQRLMGRFEQFDLLSSLPQGVATAPFVIVDRGPGFSKAQLARFTMTDAKPQVIVHRRGQRLVVRLLDPELYRGTDESAIFERLRSATNACDWRPELISTS